LEIERSATQRKEQPNDETPKTKKEQELSQHVQVISDLKVGVMEEKQSCNKRGNSRHQEAMHARATEQA
jgi:hypothetical protein